MFNQIIKRARKECKKVYIIFLRELKETKRMLEVYIYQRDNRELMQFANRQLIDIFKILLLLPLSLLPGSVIIVTLLELIAKVFKTTIFPTKTKF